MFARSLVKTGYFKWLIKELDKLAYRLNLTALGILPLYSLMYYKKFDFNQYPNIIIVQNKPYYVHY
jgi:hypothetical protein